MIITIEVEEDLFDLYEKDCRRKQTTPEEDLRSRIPKVLWEDAILTIKPF
jgi:hypothetical protein